MICKSCNGRGQTKDTATVVAVVDGRMKTVQQGSGCAACLGLGITGERRTRWPK